MLFKVWDRTRAKRKFIVAASLNELRQKGCEKFGVVRPRVVTESDGTEVEEDEVLVELTNEVLIILGDAEVWEPPDAAVTPCPARNVKDNPVSTTVKTWSAPAPVIPPPRRQSPQIKRPVQTPQVRVTCAATTRRSPRRHLGVTKRDTMPVKECRNEEVVLLSDSDDSGDEVKNSTGTGSPLTSQRRGPPGAVPTRPPQTSPVSGSLDHGQLTRSQSSQGSVGDGPLPTEHDVGVQNYSGSVTADVTKDPDELALPVFSYYVEASLKAGKSEAVWHRLVQESALFYTTHYPRRVNDATEYRRIGKTMYETYPCIGHDGQEPWSLFVKCLSQRIRRIRWERKKFADSVTKPTGTSLQPKESADHINKTSSLSGSIRTFPESTAISDQEPEPKLPKILDIKGLDKEDCIHRWKYNITEQTLAETDDKQPDLYENLPEECRKQIEEIRVAWNTNDIIINANHVQDVLSTTYESRQKWIRVLKTKKLKTILKLYPCFDNGDYLLFEMGLKFGSEEYERIRRLFPVFIRGLQQLAIEDLKVSDDDVFGMVRYMEEETKFERGKGTKTKSILVLCQGSDQPPLTSVEDAPYLAVFRSEDNVLQHTCVIANGCRIEVKSNSAEQAVLVLLAVYCCFQLEYPKEYSQILGIFQQYLLGIPYMGIKSKKYLFFSKRLAAKLWTLQAPG
ncbi:uncharacterized protein LOC106158388 isoform X1 [Lingula anatina]|uniref:Uncharacterized protein LOC106158388 isoform X1 n=1 Tax=Lingula anatina TaxID=7574 RepID=A0A1S3HW56_LINAN|nr:uncharacterized protein LOC106158388 isoform X1 [Lingula anatina]|eukprot:XP_013389781.1 uncharacterized protein LOC106158388 isoform X1 [Lingula anatina]